MDDTAKHLRDLEAQVDRLAQDTTAPQGTRTILRCISGLLMAARWQVEDRDRGPVPEYVTGAHE